jgi:hypothetical protein
MDQLEFRSWAPLPELPEKVAQFYEKREAVFTCPHTI